MAEIKAARKKLEEADLQHATNKVCQNRSWKAFMKQATDIIDQMKLCDTVFIYCDADQKMEIEEIGNNAIKLTVKEEI